MGAIFNIAFLINLMDRLSGPLASVKAKLSAFQRFNQWASEKFGSAWKWATTKAGAALTEFKTRLSTLGTEMGQLWGFSKKLMLWAGILAAPLLLAGRSFITVEEAANKFRSAGVSVMGDMGKTMDYVGGRAIAFSNTHRQSAADYYNAAYMMVAATQDERAAVAGTEWAMKMATATFGDATEAANTLAIAWLTLGDKTKAPRQEFGHLADVLTATQQTFMFKDLAQLADGFKYVAGSASAEKLSLEQLMTSLGLLNNLGMQGSMAGTAFNAVLAKLTSATGELGYQVARTSDGGLDFIKTLQNMRTKLGDATRWTDKTRESLRQAFGDEGYKAITLLVPHVDELAGAFGKVGDSAGVTGRTADQMLDSVGSKVDIIKNRLTNLSNLLAATKGGDLGAVLDGISTFLGQLIALQQTDPEAFAKYVDIFLTLIGVLAGLAVLSGLITVLMPIAAALALIGSALGLVGIAVAALIGIWLAVVYFSEKAAGSWGQLWAGLKEMFDPRPMLAQVWAFFGDAWSTIKSIFSGWWAEIRLFGRKFWDCFKEGASMAWGDVKTWFQDKLTWISGLFPHSEPKWGPLRGLTRSGETTMRMYAEGIRRGSADLARTAAQALTPAAPRPALAALGGGRQGTRRIGDVVININDRSGDSRETARLVREALLRLMNEAAEEA